MTEQFQCACFGRHGGISPVKGKSGGLLCGCFLFGLCPFPGFASLLFPSGETQILPGDLRVVGAGGFCFCVFLFDLSVVL